jgi:hypothetical protein
MLDYVMEHSRLIQELPAQANIWKVTGRYIIRNLEDLIKTYPSHIDFYCNCRNIPMFWMDLYVLCWNKNAYDVMLKNICHSIKEDDAKEYSSEQVFRKIIDKNDFNIKIVKRFRVVPELEGIRGWDNQVYQSAGIKLMLRKLANCVMPWLWI